MKVPTKWGAAQQTHTSFRLTLHWSHAEWCSKISWNWQPCPLKEQTGKHQTSRNIRDNGYWFSSGPRSPISLSSQVLKQQTLSLSPHDVSLHSAEMANLHSVLNSLLVPQEPWRGAPQDVCEHQEFYPYPSHWEVSHWYITPMVEMQGWCIYSPFR